MDKDQVEIKLNEKEEETKIKTRKIGELIFKVSQLEEEKARIVEELAEARNQASATACPFPCSWLLPPDPPFPFPPLSDRSPPPSAFLSSFSFLPSSSVLTQVQAARQSKLEGDAKSSTLPPRVIREESLGAGRLKMSSSLNRPLKEESFSSILSDKEKGDEFKT
eukprot:755142-Hanusia_phi.AAC.11